MKVTLKKLRESYPYAVDAVAYFFRGIGSGKYDNNSFIALTREYYQRLPYGVADDIHIHASQELLDREFFIASLLPPLKNFYSRPLRGTQDEILDFIAILKQLEEEIEIMAEEEQG